MRYVKQAMIVAPQPEAVEAGAQTLRAGGNVVDAAIACALVQGAVDPMMTGIAGFGSMQLYLPKAGVHTCIDFHGRARPRRAPTCGPTSSRARRATASASSSRAASTMSATSRSARRAASRRMTRRSASSASWRGATSSRRRSPMPMPVSSSARMSTASGRGARGCGREMIDRLGFTPSGKRIYFEPRARCMHLGARVRNPDMARTLRLVAEHGAEIFYSGAVAETSPPTWRAMARFDLRRSQELPHDALSAAARFLSRPRHRHRPAAGRRRHAARNAQHAGEFRPRRARPQHAGLYSYRRRGDEAGDHRQGPLRRRSPFVDVPLGRLLDKTYARDLAASIRAGEKAAVERLADSEPRTRRISRSSTRTAMRSR